MRRLFGDFTIADELRVRAGTFLTPVGYWNLILAPPLTWTTEPPVIVEETFFQPTTTGVMLFGATRAAGGQLGYSLFSQFLHPLEDDPDLDPPDYTAGLRLDLRARTGMDGRRDLSGGRERRCEWSQLGAFDLLWEHDRGEILSELYVQGGEALSSTQWGTYVQGVLEVYGPFFAVGRYEHYDPPTPDPAAEPLHHRRRVAAAAVHGREGRVPLRRSHPRTTRSKGSSRPSPRSSEMRTVGLAILLASACASRLVPRPARARRRRTPA